MTANTNATDSPKDVKPTVKLYGHALPNQLPQHMPPPRHGHNSARYKRQQQMLNLNNSSGHQQHSTNSNLNIDTWVCVLCRKMCHYKGLGDLYGPYNIDLSSDTTKNAANQEKTKTPPKKSKYSLLNHTIASMKEVWVHENCLVWSEGVHLIGRKIIKMDEVIRASLDNNCILCRTKGATLGCIGRKCRRKFHYICARDGNCSMDATNFTVKCDKCTANAASAESVPPATGNQSST